MGGGAHGGAGGVPIGVGGSGGALGGGGGEVTPVCDEGAQLGCYTGDPITEGVGPCHGGKQTCSADGQWGACEGELLPTSEDCASALDEDCDGVTGHEPEDGCACTADEHIKCPDNPVLTSPCNAGEKICNAAGTELSECTGGTFPIDEVCGNSIDDNCNGEPDEGCPCTGTSRSCYSGAVGTQGVGPCKAGTQTCDGFAWGSCVGQVIPTLEVCDGGFIDEDCDGEVNEVDANSDCICALSQKRACYTVDLAKRNVGICKDGSQTCLSTGDDWGPCLGEVTPVTEICRNDLDDDCNGTIGVTGDLPKDWLVETVPYSGNVGEGTSLAIHAATGDVWVSYREDTNPGFQLKVAHKPKGLAWEVVAIPSINLIGGASTSLDINQTTGEVWVAYRGIGPTSPLRALHGTAGNWAAIEEIETGVQSVQHSLRVDQETQTVWVSYKSAASIPAADSVYVEHKTGSGWSREEVDTSTVVGFADYSSLTVQGGEVWLAYDAEGSELKVATQTAGGPWTTGSVGIGGEYNSVARSSGGILWASHHKENTPDPGLYVASLQPTQGASWSNPQIDGGANTGTYSSLAIAPDGGIWVSYRNGTNNTLRVVHKPGSSPTWDNPVTVDSAGNVGQYTSIGVDQWKGVWVSYYDYTNKDLKVAYSCP